MRYFLYLSLIILFFGNCTRYNFDRIFHCVELTQNIPIINLVVLSDNNCGYCKIALSELEHFKNNSKIKINIVEFGTENIEALKERYAQYNFISSTSCEYKTPKPDFFPQFFLFDKNNELIWSKKGWFSRNLIEIEDNLN